MINASVVYCVQYIVSIIRRFRQKSKRLTISGFNHQSYFVMTNENMHPIKVCESAKYLIKYFYNESTMLMEDFDNF